MANKPLNNWMQLISIPVQMGSIIFIFAKIGMYLDEQYPNESNVWFLIFTLLGVALSLYNVIRQVNLINSKTK
jgi:F0F1-type ATP synthase assembly protein I